MALCVLKQTAQLDAFHQAALRESNPQSEIEI
jgi:hypothetical protein